MWLRCPLLAVCCLLLSAGWSSAAREQQVEDVSAAVGTQSSESSSQSSCLLQLGRQVRANASESVNASGLDSTRQDAKLSLAGGAAEEDAVPVPANEHYDDRDHHYIHWLSADVHSGAIALVAHEQMRKANLGAWFFCSIWGSASSASGQAAPAEQCYFGLTRLSVAVLLTGLAMSALISCVPFLLLIARRRPPDSALFAGSIGCCEGSAEKKQPMPSILFRPDAAAAANLTPPPDAAVAKGGFISDASPAAAQGGDCEHETMMTVNADAENEEAPSALEEDAVI